MKDPFQDVSGADAETIGLIVDALETRAADPQMTPIIDAYLAALEWPAGGLLLEIGSGTGGIGRRIAAHYAAGRVLGIEPSPDLLAEAQRRAEGIGNLSFALGTGAALELADASVDIALFHTVLSHVPQPEALLLEASRVLRPGGQLVVCDADFSKLSLGNVAGDPLQACAVCIRENFVTNPWLAASLRRVVAAAGFDIVSFALANRLVLSGEGGRAWVRMATAYLTAAGVIGADLAAALLGEYQRRSDAGTLYGFQPFATLIARKP
jgi:ubiquinone/menaquinone biosynthesis C-methylase UbiE